MRQYFRILFLVVLISPSLALAQQWTDVTLVTPHGYVPSSFAGQSPAAYNPVIPVSLCNSDASYCATEGINLQNFASTSYVNSQFAGFNSQLGMANGSISTLGGQVSSLSAQLGAQAGQITALQTQVAGFSSHFTALDSEISALQAQVYQQANRATELAVIAGAMRDAVPNTGDRYALRVNLAGANSHAAGGASVSANLNDSFRLSLNYGRGQRQDMFGGGLNFSFN